MRPRHIILLAGILIVAGTVGDAMTQVDTLTVIHVNDTHSHLVPYGPKDKNSNGFGTRGGIARAATYIGGIQAAEENVLFLHAGDLFVGDFMFNKYFGVAELQLLAQLGCDALTLGNHEFDLTPEVLKLALTEAGFPMPGFDILSANLDMTADPDLAALVQPYTIRDVGNLRVGIFGLTTEATNVFSMPAPVTVTSCIEGAFAAVAVRYFALEQHNPVETYLRRRRLGRGILWRRAPGREEQHEQTGGPLSACDHVVPECAVDSRTSAGPLSPPGCPARGPR